MLPNGLELSCPAVAGSSPFIVAHIGGPDAPPYGPARRVSFSELLGGVVARPRISHAREECLVSPEPTLTWVCDLTEGPQGSPAERGEINRARNPHRRTDRD